MSQQQQQGEKLFQSYMDTIGGLNLSDSVFAVSDTQATGGFNWEYLTKGGIQKSYCPGAINTVADAQLKTLGIALRNTKVGAKTIIRAAGTKIQLTTLAGTFTDLLSDDSSESSDFLTSTTQPVVNGMFITPGVDYLWLAGGGMGLPVAVIDELTTSNASVQVANLLITAVAADATGNALSVVFTGGATPGFETATVVGNVITISIAPGVSTTNQVRDAIIFSAASASLLNAQATSNAAFNTLGTFALTGGGRPAVTTTEVTQNGTPAPTGSITATDASSSLGSFLSTGPYYYAVAYRKRSTQALSNAVLDEEATVVAVTDTVTIDLSMLTNRDVTLYDAIYIFRSAVNGAQAFTEGDWIAELPISATSYTDDGDSIIGADGADVPRAGSITLDNSTLPAGTYNTLTVWKNRLVVSNGSTVYISDLNKPESWPLTNIITIPSGGNVLALSSIAFTPNAVSTDQFLVIFKDTELWNVTGTDYTNFALKFVDFCGCLGQNLIAQANGNMFFIDNRGVYTWSGNGKPTYLSRLIEYSFGINGTLDRGQLQFGCGVFYRKQNEIVWYLTDQLVGEQQYVLKLDLRLTMPLVNGYIADSSLSGRIIDGIFLQGMVNNPVYAAAAFIFPTSSNQDEVLVTGDDAGFTYRQFFSPLGTGPNDYNFTYLTKHLDMGKPGQYKQFYQVVVWVDNIGNWPLILDYWTDFRQDDADKNTVSAVINNSSSGTQSLWDVALWDVALWDGPLGASGQGVGGSGSKPKRLVFNLLAAPYNNNQGETIRLQFRNQNNDQPILIYGFGISYALLGTRT